MEPKDAGPLIQQLQIPRTVPRFGEIVLLVEFPMLEIRQKENSPAMQWFSVSVSHIRWWETAPGIVIVRDLECDLLEVSFVWRLQRRPPGAGGLGDQCSNENRQHNPAENEPR